MEKFNIGRREFLKTAGLLSAVLFVRPLLGKADAKMSGDGKLVTEHRILGSGDAAMKVSALGFGCMGMNYNRGMAKDEKEMIKLLHKCVDYGVNLFDTAEVYGPHINEILVGKGLYEYKDVNVTTKFGHKIIDGKYYNGELDSSPKQIRKVCEESLKRLRRDVIGMFYQHRFDPKVPIEDVAGTVKELIQEGKVRHFGLCEVSPEIIRKAHAVQPLTAIQSEYHLMWQGPEKNIFPTLEELGIGFVPYSPLNRGYLAGAMNENTKFYEKNDNRQTLPRFTPEAMKNNYIIIEVMKEFGLPKGASPAQVALAWLLHKRPYIVPIPGTTVKSHLKENLEALNFQWTNKEWSDFEAKISKIEIVGDRYNAIQQKQVNN